MKSKLTTTKRNATKATTKATATKPTGAKVEALQSKPTRLELAEENCKKLENDESVFLGIPVSRLQQIRHLPFSCYPSLNQKEKFYWVEVQTRRGENREKLLNGILRYERNMLEEELEQPARILKQAVLVAGLATKQDIETVSASGKNKIGLYAERLGIYLNEEKKTIFINGKELKLTTPRQWKIAKLFLNSKDDEGWVTLPNGYKDVNQFKGSNEGRQSDAFKFSQHIENNRGLKKYRLTLQTREPNSQRPKITNAKI